MPEGKRPTDGPTGRGLYFNGDLEFREAGTGITRGDRFMNLFTGYFYARVQGNYEFGLENPDDTASFWLDLDRDGTFESTVTR